MLLEPGEGKFHFDIPKRPLPLCGRGHLGQASCESRNLQRTESVMSEPSEIGFEKRAQIWDAVFQHGQTIQPHTTGEALVLFWIKPTSLDDIGMHHAGA